MVRILYGVCGVGAGHYMRSKIILEHLIKKHDVFIIASLGAYDYLKKEFKNVHYVDGLELAFSSNRVLNLRTILKNIRKFSPKNYGLLKKLKAKIDKFEPQIVISDFEPFSIYYSKDNKIKCVSFDNEHYITEGELNFPKKYNMDYLKTKFIINFYKTDEIAITIFPGQKIRKNSIGKTLMPLIRESLNNPNRNKEYVLVYTSIIKNPEIYKIFKKLNEKFLIFGAEENKKEDNLYFKIFSNKEFDYVLLNCKAVITTGGMNLISEAIYLGKPILVIPIKNHFEQILNALYVKENNYGEFYDELNEENLSNFLNNLNKYKIESFKPGNKEAFKLVENIIKGVKK